MNHLRQAWAKQIKDAQVLVFGAPPVPGLSVAGGFKLVVEDPSGLGLPTLERQTNALVGKLAQGAGTGGRLDPVPREYAAAFHGYRPAPRRPPWAFPSAT